MYGAFIANLLLAIRDDPSLFDAVIEKMDYSDFVDHRERFTEAAKWVYRAKNEPPSTHDVPIV